MDPQQNSLTRPASLPLDYRSRESDRGEPIALRAVAIGLFKALLAFALGIVLMIALATMYTVVIVCVAMAFVAVRRLDASVALLALAIVSTIVLLAIAARRSWRQRRAPVQ